MALQDGSGAGSEKPPEATAQSGINGTVMARATQKRKASTAGIGTFLTFDRMVAGQVILLIYWSGLGIIALIGFSVIGAGVGLAMREDGLSGWLLGGPLLVAGILVVIALTLLWRAICEFYIAVFRISDDLRALRRNDDALFAARAEQRATPQAMQPSVPSPTQPPLNY